VVENELHTTNKNWAGDLNWAVYGNLSLILWKKGVEEDCTAGHIVMNIADFSRALATIKALVLDKLAVSFLLRYNQFTLSPSS